LLSDYSPNEKKYKQLLAITQEELSNGYGIVQDDTMKRVEQKMKLSDEKFKRRIGTTKPVFSIMLDILQIAYDKLHETGGAPPNLTVGDKLLITLKYYRRYVYKMAPPWNPSPTIITAPKAAFFAPFAESKQRLLPMVDFNCPVKKY
jgi:hypothetical protein